MTQIFISGFTGMLGALGRIFVVVLIAGVLVRKKIINQEQINGLSKATVMVFLPSLVFSNTLKNFDPSALAYWYLLPLLGAGMSLFAFLLGRLVFFKDYTENKDMIAIASMQNAGYLVLPVGQLLFPDHFEQFAVVTFLFLLGFNPVLWTVGKYLSTSAQRTVRPTWKDFITPPATANLLSLLIVILGIQHIFPLFLLDSLNLVGGAAVPTATFILGATLAGVSVKHLPKFKDTARVVLIKYLLVPGITMTLLILFNIPAINPLIANFLMIQAAAAPAVGVILQTRTYGGNAEKVSGMMLIAYILCLLAMPTWMAFWQITNL